MFLWVTCSGSRLNISLLQILLKKAPLSLRALEGWKGLSLQRYLVWSWQACQRIYGSSPRLNHHHPSPKGAVYRFAVWVFATAWKPERFLHGLRSSSAAAGRLESGIQWQGRKISWVKIKWWCYHAFKPNTFLMVIWPLFWKAIVASLIGSTHLQNLELLTLLTCCHNGKHQQQKSM